MPRPSVNHIPEFRPHQFLRGGHAQTIAATLLPVPRPHTKTVRHTVGLTDGDRINLHDDCPETWRAGERVVMLIHGLCGSFQSNYMMRIASKLADRGVRVFRMDLRGSGAGAGLATRPYNAGRSEDAREALEFVANLCPTSPISVVGFSLGGNILLKMLGEAPEASPANLISGVAVSPVIDLAAGVDNLSRGAARFYDRYFTKQLNQQVHQYAATVHAEIGREITPAANLRTFDDLYTAPLSGYRDAADYYAKASSHQFIPQVRLPTLVLAAEDDPVVPVEMHRRVAWPDCVRTQFTSRGGHVAFIAASRGSDPDRRWMDWRVVDWVTRD